MQRLSGLDGAFLSLETEATPMHVGSLHVFEPPPRYRRDFYDGVRQMMETRLHLAPVLRRQLAATPLQLADPVWIEGEVDFDYHMRRIELPAPGSMEDLQAAVADAHGELLDRGHPLWMLYVFDGLADGRKAYYFKIHHAMLDGQAGAALAATLFDLTPTPPRATPKPAAPAERRPGALALVAQAFRHDAAQYVKLVRYLPQIGRTLAGFAFGGGPKGAGRALSGALSRNASFGPRTPLNRTITPERSFAGVSISLAEAKEIAHARGVTLNDVALALCSGMLRRYLTRHGGLPRKSLMATMPISLRAAGDKSFTTQATLSLVNLATDVADPLKRLDALHAASGATKAVASGAKSIIPVDFPTIGGPWLIGALASLYGRVRVADVMPPLANVVISNVPGPPMPLYAAGARMTDYWPLSIVEHGVGLNITMMSYNGTIGVGFTAARCAVPDAQELARDFVSALDQLRKAVAAEAQPAPRKSRATASARAAGAERTSAKQPVRAASAKGRARKAPARKKESA